nr:hypothetical protein [Pseudomonadota bacterium]
GDARGHRIRVVGLSYDGRYDTPERLKQYGLARDFPFGEDALLVRCKRGWPTLRKALRLSVGYGDTTVNEHAREVFLINRDGKVRPLAIELFNDPATLLRTLQT